MCYSSLVVLDSLVFKSTTKKMLAFIAFNMTLEAYIFGNANGTHVLGRKKFFYMYHADFLRPRFIFFNTIY